MIIVDENVEEVLLHQLKSHWINIDEQRILEAVPIAMDAIKENYTGIPNKRFWNGEEVVFSPYMSVQWMNFLYRLSHVLYLNSEGRSADQVYYLNKILHSNDWFYAIDLPKHFHCEHPLGSVLGRANYGDYLFVYQGTTIGGNRSHGVLHYPTIGNNVILYANATILGDCNIGDNVVISSGSYLINETIPNNCIVFGQSPKIIIKEKTESEIKEYTQYIWGWN